MNAQDVLDRLEQKLADSDLTEGKRMRYEKVLRDERFQVAVINSVERNERPLTTAERERRVLGQQRINKIEGALNE